MASPSNDSPTPIPTRHDDKLFDADKPFDGDRLERSLIAERLNQFVERLPAGCVIGIDAPWGEGKSWFGTRWASQLRSRGHRVAWLDAFESDWTDDPFLALTAEIRAQSGATDSKKKKLVDTATQVAKAALPIAGKAAVSFLARAALGTNGLETAKDAFEAAGDDAGNAAEKYIERRLADHDLHKQSAEAFRSALTSLAAQNGKAMIFFIDELDRCRPDYAVRLIERIKHFFDVPGLIFVLFLNRAQIEQAIKGIYGQSVDAHAYLGKFVQFFVKLPKPSPITDPSRNFNHRYAEDLRNTFGLPPSYFNEAFVDFFAAFASHFNLSLRDLEKGFVLFSLAQPVGESAPFLAWMIALKLAKPDIFYGIASRSPQAHAEAEALLANLPTGGSGSIVKAIQALHRLGSKGDLNSLPDGNAALGPVNSIGTWVLRPEEFLGSLAAKIDIPVF